MLLGAKSRGFTLVEVVIATLLLAVGVAGVFSVTLSARVQSKRHAGRDKINQYGRRLGEELKSYVTGADPLKIHQGLPGGEHKHPDDTCTQWALSETCNHDVTSMLPQELRSAPYNARLTYQVYAPAKAGDPRKVEISMTWSDP